MRTFQTPSTTAATSTSPKIKPTVINGVTVSASQVTVTYNRSPLILGTPLLAGGDFTLTGRAVFRNLY